MRYQIKLFCTLVVLAVTGSSVDAQWRLRRYQPQQSYSQWQPTTVTMPVVSASTGTVLATTESGAVDGLDEVNAKRATMGLRPFIRDDGLTRAAQATAVFRAANRLFGHTSNDFSFLPSGASASAAGCAAYPASYGWMSCCVEEQRTYAGAAWAMGADGKRYMHLFVR